MSIPNRLQRFVARREVAPTPSPHTGAVILALAITGTAPAISQTSAPNYRFVHTLHAEFAGLDGAFDLVADSTGRDLYVSGFLEDSIVHFKRDPVSGALTWFSSTVDGQASVVGLDGPEQLALSPDGTTLYAAAHNADGLVAFQRDPATGLLSWATAYSDPVLLEGTATVAVSPTGDRVYVGGFLAGGLQVFLRNPPLLAQPLYGISHASLQGTLAIVVVPLPGSQALLYVAGSGSDTLSVWLDTGTQIVPVQSFTDGLGGIDGLDGINDLELSADGQHLYATSFQDSAVVHFIRDTNGLLQFVSAQAFLEFDQLARGELSPNEDLFYVSSSGDDQLYSLTRDTATGALSWPPVQRSQRGGGVGTYPGLDNPYGLLAVGSHVYTTGLLSDSVVVFDEFPPRSFVPFAFPKGGQLQEAREIGSGIYADARPYLAHLRELVPGGNRPQNLGYQRFYGAQESPYGGVVSLLSHEPSGQLLTEWVLPAPQASTSTVLASPDGRFLYVGYDYDGGSGRIEVWEIGFPGAEPFAVQGLSPGGGSPDGVRDLAFGPSGLQLYMIAPNGALLVYDRDPATGMLTYNTSRVPALFDELLDLACSPQGDALFATARNSDGVVRWALDSAGIPSTAVQYVSTAAAPLEVEVSRDGTRLYFTTAGAYRLHNAQIVGSALGSIQTLVPPGLPRDLSEGPDGRVYVAAHQHDAARVWQRGANGLLTELGDLDADVCAPSSQQPCLDTASAVAVGEDGKSILVAGAGVLFGNPSGGIALIEDQSVIFVDGFEGNGIGRWSASTEVPI